MRLGDDVTGRLLDPDRCINPLISRVYHWSMFGVDPRSATLPSVQGEVCWLAKPDSPGLAPPSVRRDAFAGLMISAMLVASVVHGLAPGFPRETGVLAAWAAGCAVWNRLPFRAQVQVGLMFGVGLACIALAAARGGDVAWGIATGGSLPILTVLAGVAFLRLVYLAGAAARTGAPAPRGFGAYLRTMAGVHLFGAVINISAVVVFAERLARSAPLTRREAAMLGRSYSMVAYYSPFIGGVALALSLVPGVHFPGLVLTGVTLACTGLLVLAVMGHLEEGAALSRFEGYPFRLESLWLPFALVCLTAVMHWMWPSLSILVLVALIAPSLAAAVLVARSGTAGARRTLKRFVLTELSGMSGEFTLFLAAGVLGGGLTSLVSAYPLMVPDFTLDPATATLALACIVVAAMAGVHPLVSVTTLIAVTSTASPDPTLLAAVCVTGWGIGSAASPYSGINLVLAARCGVSSWSFPRWNALYCTIMVLAAGAVFAGYAALVR